MIRGSVARRYSKALMQVAQKAGNVDAVAAELERLGAAIRTSRDLVHVMENPAFGLSDRHKILAALAERLALSDATRRFLTLLLDRGRFGALPGIVLTFQDMADEVAGRVRAEVTSAEPLNAAYRKRLLEVLERTTGKKVVLTEKVDVSLLGGMVTRVGDRMFDGTLKNRIARVRAQLLH